MPKKDIVLIYPLMGMSGALVRHMPLSLVYAAADSVAVGFEVHIVDVRLCPDSWHTHLEAAISANTLLVGISVMTGAPIKSALTMSRWLKDRFPDTPIVWGGPHATFCGPQILRELTVDFVIAGYGSAALARLALSLNKSSDDSLSTIPGLIYRSDNHIVAVPVAPVFEIIPYEKIPYHLIEKSLHLYGQLENGERIFPMYSAMGCPYQCSFCSSPAHYASFGSKYLCYSTQEVAAHVAFVKARYDASYIYFIDDDSFVDLNHVMSVIDEIQKLDIKVRLGFRGARIDEIQRMDDRYLAKLASAGTDILHIGAESGSQRILDLLGKNTTVEDILQVNRKLARHQEITPAYNFIVGLPGETLADLQATRDLVINILADNPSAIIFTPNKYRPLPGTKLYERAVESGYLPPVDLDGWSEIEVEGDYRAPWYTGDFAKMIDMMQVTSYFIDDKLEKLATGDSLKFRIARWAGRLYAPLAKLRYRYGITALFWEYRLFRFMVNRLKG